MKFLALDTASGQCSAALWLDGSTLARSERTARGHATLILPMVDVLLREADVSLRQLDGIAFGRGPGSFTGIRVACGVAQGLALGADLGVLPVSDLMALAEQAKDHQGSTNGRGAHEEHSVLVCMDARMGEVYWGCYTSCKLSRWGWKVGGSEAVSAPAQVNVIAGLANVCGAGMGWSAYAAQLRQTGIQTTEALAAMEPHAAQIASLTARAVLRNEPWLDAAQAQPVYLRDQVAQLPTSKPTL